MKNNKSPIGIIHEKGFRSYQEDAYGYEFIPPYWIFVVADGMGGMDKGDLASKTIVNEILDAFYHNKNLLNENEIKEIFKEGLIRALNGIHKLVAENEVAGSTLTLAAWNNQTKNLWLTWVGDSRIYLLLHKDAHAIPDPSGKDGRMCVAIDQTGYRLFTLTEDHSIVWTFFKRGEMTFDQLKDHPYKNKLTLSLSSNISINQLLKNVHLRKFHIENIETATLMLCTDGVWESIDSSSQLLEIMKNSLDNPTRIASEIRQVVRRNQGKIESGDNFTAIITNLGRLPLVASQTVKKVSAQKPKIEKVRYNYRPKRNNWFKIIFLSLLLIASILSGFYFFNKSQQYSSKVKSQQNRIPINLENIKIKKKSNLINFINQQKNKIVLFEFTPPMENILKKYLEGKFHLENSKWYILCRIGNNFYIFDLNKGNMQMALSQKTNALNINKMKNEQRKKSRPKKKNSINRTNSSQVKKSQKKTKDKGVSQTPLKNQQEKKAKNTRKVKSQTADSTAPGDQKYKFSKIMPE